MAKSVIKDIIIKKLANGKKTYNAILEDGITGYFNPKTDFEFIKGELVEYTVSEYTSKKNVTSNILALSKITDKSNSEEPKPSIPPQEREWHSGKSFTEMKHEARLHLIELVTRLIIAGKIEVKEAGEYYTEWVSMVDGTIDELKA